MFGGGGRGGVMVILKCSLMFAFSSKELSSLEPMDTGKPTEKATNKRYEPLCIRHLLLPFTEVTI